MAMRGETHPSSSAGTGKRLMMRCAPHVNGNDKGAWLTMEGRRILVVAAWAADWVRDVDVGRGVVAFLSPTRFVSVHIVHIWHWPGRLPSISRAEGYAGDHFVYKLEQCAISQPVIRSVCCTSSVRRTGQSSGRGRIAAVKTPPV